MNMEQRYSFKCLAFQEEAETFTSVCLDLDIIEEGHQTLEEAILSLNDAIESHLRAASEAGYPKELLYRPAPRKYWKKLNQLMQYSTAPVLLTRPIQVFTSSATVSSAVMSRFRDFKHLAIT